MGEGGNGELEPNNSQGVPGATPQICTMPPQSRHRRNYNIVGHAHELTFCCYQRYKFLKAERTCRWLAEAINDARVELQFDLWAYVFMPDHVHLIIHPRVAPYDMASIRTAIKKPASKAALSWLRENEPSWIPRLTRQRGHRTETHFWQSGGGYDRNIEEGGTLLKMIDYIHMNPVRKGFVERPEEWNWSSARQFLGSRQAELLVDPIPADCLS